MIKVTNGNLELSGTRLDILCEFTTLIHSLVVDSKFLSKKDVNDCVELALLSSEELAEKVISDFTKQFSEFKKHSED